MNYDSQAAIIANDLDSLAFRVEALQAHPRYTEAVQAIVKAKQAVNAARVEIHQADLRARYAAMDEPSKPTSDRMSVGE